MTHPDHSLHPARLLDDGRKLAAVASMIFIVSLFLPWYEKSVFPTGAKSFVTTSLSAFGAFTWVEAALLLVDAAVLALLYLRSTNRRVELPGSDGTMIAVAGGWMIALLIVRVFDKPSVSGEGVAASVGLQWGLLIAMAAAGAILAAGLATRAIERAAKSGGAPSPADDVAPVAPASDASEDPTRVNGRMASPLDPSEDPTEFGAYGSDLDGPPRSS